jgi:putative Ca2+/H+ antiporter (TMEM165/GDT1 family)
MGSWIAALATAYGLVLLLELPDKTTVLTLVLTTRFRPLPVLAGASVAFALQAAIAVGLGSAITLLPDRLVSAVVTLVFGIGAVLLFRESLRKPDTDAADEAGTPRLPATAFRAMLTTLTTLFLAEWGDSSQLAAVGVAAKYAQPVAIAIGTFLALMSVTLLALFIGRKLRGRIPTRLVHRVAGAVFAGFSAFGLWHVVTG